MKDFRKKLTVLVALITLTGCGQVVQDMHDIPVMN